MTYREKSNKKGMEYISLIVMTFSASAMAITCTYEEHINWNHKYGSYMEVN